MYQKDKFSDSKVKFRQASNHCKRVLEAAKLAYANKTKESETCLSGLFANCKYCSQQGISTIPPLFNSPEVLSSAPDKAKLFEIA